MSLKTTRILATREARLRALRETFTAILSDLGKQMYDIFPADGWEVVVRGVTMQVGHDPQRLVNSMVLVEKKPSPKMALVVPLDFADRGAGEKIACLVYHEALVGNGGALDQIERLMTTYAERVQASDLEIREQV